MFSKPKKYGILSLSASLAVLAAMALWACTDDGGESVRHGQRVVFEAQTGTTAFSEHTTGESSRATRAWTPPSGYTTYKGFTAMFENQADLFYKSIDVYFTTDGNAPLQGTFFYNSNATTEAKWRFVADKDLDTKTYYLYGYIPKEVAESSAIAANGTYSNGAVLTLNGLKTVTHSDVSVIVAAKNGTDNDTDGGLTIGDFAVAAKATAASEATVNHVFLLFDHLYSALRFNFKVDPEYAELRTIKLTKLELTANESLGSTRLKAKYNATVTLKAGANPTIQSVTFTPDETSADQAYETIYSGDEVTLSSTEETAFMGCFVPGQNTSFYLRSTYNVYDRKGKLVREGCEAVNAIDLRSLYSITATELQRGHRYSITLTVRPTYLYVLSEPDLDNPTISLKTE